MSYYFPFGASSAVSVQNISYSLQATTASRPDFSNIPVVPSASYAPSVQNSPAAGANGLSKNIDSCSATAPVGLPGLTGLAGAKGMDFGYCPAGTKECPNLHVSLSAVWTNGTNFGVNYYRASI